MPLKMDHPSSRFPVWRASLTVAAAAWFAGCSGGKTVQANKSALDDAVPVTTGLVVRKPMPVELRAIGAVEAYSTVIVKSQLQGELTRVAFSEGQDVKKGDLLFEIDPRPY